MFFSIPFSRFVLLFTLLFAGPSHTHEEDRGKSIRVTVEPHVTLDVVDWGGSGSPMILLSGLGDDAHVFDAFAHKFTSLYHVYGITREDLGHRQLHRRSRILATTHQTGWTTTFW